MVRMQKRDRRKKDQIGMDAQSCLLIPNVKKKKHSEKCILKELSFKRCQDMTY